MPWAIAQQEPLRVELYARHNVQVAKLVHCGPCALMVSGQLLPGAAMLNVQQIQLLLLGLSAILSALALRGVLSLALNVGCNVILEGMPVRNAFLVLGVLACADVIVLALLVSRLATRVVALALTTQAKYVMSHALKITLHPAALASAALMDNGVLPLADVSLLVPASILTLSASLTGTLTVLITTAL